MSRPADILITVLGAGRAARFGADKLVQRCAGRPLGAWALEAALQAGRTQGAPVIWIAGERAPDFVTCEVALHPRAAEGIGTSVALAAACARDRGVRALLILLADMPLVRADLLARLIAAGAPAACRQADGRPGVPALIPASAFPALMALTGDRGAGPVLAAMAGLTLLDCAPRQLLDVDRPEALAEAAALLEALPPTPD